MFFRLTLNISYISSLCNKWFGSPSDIQFDKNLIKIFTLDIEVTAEKGFPDVENPIEEILCLTIKNQSNKNIITWVVLCDILEMKSIVSI